MKRLLILSAMILALGACDKGKGGGGGDGDSASFLGGFSVDAEVKALQGSWLVKDSAFGKDKATWIIKDTSITIKEGKDAEKKATLVIKYPGVLGVKTGDMTSFYAYARDGAKVYIGLGDAGVKLGDKYMVGVSGATSGVIVFDGKTCNFHKRDMFKGLKEKGEPAKCSIADDGGKKVLKYQLPKFMKKDEFEDHSIEIVGNALLNDQMKGSLAEKAK